MSAADAQRFPGSGARARASTASHAAGTPGTERERGSGGSEMRRMARRTTFCSEGGRLPDSISWTINPNENTSVAGVKGHLGRCYLKGTAGDAANAILTAVGYNFRRILAWLRILLCLILAALWRALVTHPALKLAC